MPRTVASKKRKAAGNTTFRPAKKKRLGRPVDVQQLLNTASLQVSRKFGEPGIALKIAGYYRSLLRHPVRDRINEIVALLSNASTCPSSDERGVRKARAMIQEILQYMERFKDDSKVQECGLKALHDAAQVGVWPACYHYVVGNSDFIPTALNAFSTFTALRKLCCEFFHHLLDFRDIGWCSDLAERFLEANMISVLLDHDVITSYGFATCRKVFEIINRIVDKSSSLSALARLGVRLELRELLEHENQQFMILQEKKRLIAELNSQVSQCTQELEELQQHYTTRKKELSERHAALIGIQSRDMRQWTADEMEAHIQNHKSLIEDYRILGEQHSFIAAKTASCRAVIDQVKNLIAECDRLAA